MGDDSPSGSEGTTVTTSDDRSDTHTDAKYH
jgi:hypothetical protein